MPSKKRERQEREAVRGAQGQGDVQGARGEDRQHPRRLQEGRDRAARAATASRAAPPRRRRKQGRKGGKAAARKSLPADLSSGSSRAAGGSITPGTARVIEEDPALPARPYAVSCAPRRSRRRRWLALTPAAAPRSQGSNVDPDQVDAVEAPDLGACRVLTPDDVAQPSNATKTVDCDEPHTAETFAVGQLPEEFADADYDDREIGSFAYTDLQQEFMGFLGADESLVMRTAVSWAWFRPSEKAWDEGARWYRCDVVGGGDDSKSYVDLPETAKGLLLKQHDHWMVCVNGPTVNGRPRSLRRGPHLAGGHDHQARGAGGQYPGDRLVEVTRATSAPSPSARG